MKVLNYGSLNYDFVYSVPHMVTPGETLSSTRMETHCGGKGLNQSIAMARSGVTVCHGGMVGEDGADLIAALKKDGIDCTHITTRQGKSGHAIIQVNPQGENCIILYEGANGKNSVTQIQKTLESFEEGDLLVLQNEVNELPALLQAAYKRNMRVVLNPSPYNAGLEHCDLKEVFMFVLNEIEGWQMTGKKEPEEILKAMKQLYPNSEVVLTLGKNGSCYCGREGEFFHPSFPVETVDTTAAGDTFTGYLVGGILDDLPMEQVLLQAAAAAAIAVTKKGAAPSIPAAEDVKRFLEMH